MHIGILGGFDMNVKGTIYLTGKTTMIAAFGEERWNSFMTKLAEKDKYFSNDDYVHYPHSGGKINPFF